MLLLQLKPQRSLEKKCKTILSFNLYFDIWYNLGKVISIEINIYFFTFLRIVESSNFKGGPSPLKREATPVLNSTEEISFSMELENW